MADHTDLLPLGKRLSSLNKDLIHMSISRKVHFSLVDKLNLYYISISSLLSCKKYFSICNSIERSSSRGSEIHTIVTSMLHIPSTQIVSTKEYRIRIGIQWICSILLKVCTFNKWKFHLTILIKFWPSLVPTFKLWNFIYRIDKTRIVY